MIKQKIKRNFNVLEIIELENKITKLEMIIKYRLLKYNDAFVKEIKKINQIEVQQLYQYSLEREAEIINLTNNINSLELNIKDIQNEINEMKNQCLFIIDKINKLDEEIPLSGFISNLEIKV